VQLGEQPKPPRSTDQSTGPATTAAAPTEDDDDSQDAAHIAKRLAQKLPPDVFREAVAAMCDLLHSNGVRDSTQ
jgi:hypothetical protein